MIFMYDVWCIFMEKSNLLSFKISINCRRLKYGLTFKIFFYVIEKFKSNYQIDYF